MEVVSAGLIREGLATNLFCR